jgi:MSHA biogenesis protein MshN
MSVINQVLKDLDQRQPMGNAVKHVDAGVSGLPAKQTDWVRIFIWGWTACLVIGYLVYTWFEENPAPGNVPVVMQPVVPVASVVKSPDVVPELPKQMAVSEPVASSPSVRQTEAVSENKIEPAYLPLRLDEEDMLSGKQTVVKESAVKPVKSAPATSSKSIVSVKPVTRPTVEHARQLINGGQLTEAENQLEKLIKATPSDIQSRELLIGLLLRSQRTVEAEKQIEAAKRFYPVRENLALLSAKIRLDGGDTVAAQAVLEKQVAINKAGENTYAMLAPLYQQQGAFEESARLYRKLLEKNRNNGRYWMGLAVALEALKDQANAANAYRQARQSGSLQPELARYAEQRLAAIESMLASSTGNKQ